MSTSDDSRCMSLTAYHSSLQHAPVNPASVIAILAFFFEKGDYPATGRHWINSLKKTTEFLNPGQIPLILCDCPVFLRCKYIRCSGLKILLKTTS